jgi:uncharacterized protein (DUF2164 family)
MVGGRPQRRADRKEPWQELKWRIEQIEHYLRIATYHKITERGEYRYCDAGPIFEILEQKLAPDFYNQYNSPSGAYDVDQREEALRASIDLMEQRRRANRPRV